MASSGDMPDRAVLAAIDVARHRNGILIEIPGRTRRRRLTILDTRADRARLVEVPAGVEFPVAAGFEGEAPAERRLPSPAGSPAADGRGRSAPDPVSGAGAQPGSDHRRMRQERSRGCPDRLHMLRIGQVRRDGLDSCVYQ